MWDILLLSNVVLRGLRPKYLETPSEQQQITDFSLFYHVFIHVGLMGESEAKEQGLVRRGL